MPHLTSKSCTDLTHLPRTEPSCRMHIASLRATRDEAWEFVWFLKKNLQANLRLWAASWPEISTRPLLAWRGFRIFQCLSMKLSRLQSILLYPHEAKMYDERSDVDKFSGDKDPDWPQCMVARLPTKVIKDKSVHFVQFSKCTTFIHRVDLRSGYLYKHKSSRNMTKAHHLVLAIWKTPVHLIELSGFENNSLISNCDTVSPWNEQWQGRFSDR